MSGKRIIKQCIYKLPARIYPVITKCIKKTSKRRFAYRCDFTRCVKGIVSEKAISSYKKVLVITGGRYSYKYLNVCYINNMLSLCIKALNEGYIPLIKTRFEGGVLWEQYFMQPFEQWTSGKKCVIYSSKDMEAIPSWNDVYDKEKVSQWGYIYNSFLILNEKMEKYIGEEINTILGKRRVLGVLCRGTDYALRKPKRHPIQPEPEDILQKSKELFYEKKYEYIYLATDDSKYHTLFQECFGDKLLINKREYYDQLFQEQNCQLIGEVHFHRDNDDYYKGLEYLSSLYILSKCQGLVAGNCGGTMAAVFLNNNQYEDEYIYKLGLYT